MTSVDLDDWMQVWQDEQDEDELELVRASARRAMRRARLFNYAEHGISAAIIVAVIVWLVLEGAPATIAIAGLAILVILWSSWRRHMLFQVAELIRFDDRRDFLETGVQSARARLKRSRIGLIALLPSFLIGIYLKDGLAHGGAVGDLSAPFWESVTSGGSAAVALLLFVLVALWFGAAHLRLRAEVSRLEQLRDEYRVEASLDGDGAA